MKKYNAIILGFGKAGKTLAADLAAAGKSVALIEKSDRMYGGTCINVGCIPTKSLVHSAQISKQKAPETFEEKAKLYQDAVEEKERLTSILREKNFQKLNHLEQVTIYHGIGSFLSAHEIQVVTAQETLVLEGEQIFINTGSKPFVPPIKGLEGNSRVFTSETLLNLTELPRKLAIVGGGYIGLEFASFYTNFGSEVTVFQKEDTFLPREDTDISAEIQKVFEKRGVRFQKGVDLVSIQEKKEKAILSYQKDGEAHIFEADAVLIATGRQPNTQDLHLERAGIETTFRGAVPVDDALRTVQPHIWAMGDVVGGLQFTYISLDDYRIVRSQLFNGEGESRTVKTRKNIPYSVFLEPPFSRVGLHEREAIQQGYQVKIAKLPAAAIPKAQVLQETDGLLKAIINAENNQILGVMLFCAESYEMINLIKLAMDANLPYTILKNQIFTHPTMSEALNDLFSAIS